MYRQKDWRFGVLAFAMGFIAVRRLFIILSGPPPSGPLGELPGIMLGAATLAAMFTLDNTLAERDRAVQELRKSHQQLRELAARLDTAREEERGRISREIHDEIGQVLTGLKIETKLFSKEIQNSHPHLLPRTQDMQHLIDRTMVVMREIATELRPSILDNLGLIAAIEWHAETFQERTGIECFIRADFDDKGITDNLATAVFRILQESLTNVLKHSEATEVSISLTQSDGNLLMSVQDNGNGFSEDSINKPHAMGVIGMRERALAFSGEVNIRNAPGGGTIVSIVIPLNHHESTV
ncbi:MAG: sensor histidine kinase [Blastocatellia bacterium]